MIDTSPASLIERIKACERLRDASLSKMESQVRAFHTPAYDGEKGEALPENHLFEYISLRIGQLAFNNPRVKVTTTGTGERRESAKAYHHALNRWIRDTAFNRLAEKLAMDYFFSYGVTITSPKPAPGFEEAEDPIYWPSIARIDQKCFGFDSQAKSYEEARYAFHVVTEDKRDLLDRARADAGRDESENEGWKLEAIKSLVDGNVANPDRNNRNTVSDDSSLVSYYEIWIPNLRIDEENTPDKGFHGAIFTIAYDAGSNKSAEIREARDYWGPRWGPYTIYGAYTVPGKPWPLSPLAAAWRQIEEDNLHAEVISRSASNYKRMVFVDETDKRLAKKIKDGKHDFVYPIGGFDKAKVQEIEVGGIKEEMLAVKAITKDRAERMLGMSDAEKGMVTGDATATENAIAAGSSQTRGAWQAKKFWDACERNLYSALWFIVNGDNVVIEMGEEAERDLGEAPVYLGKVTPESWPRQRKMLKSRYPNLDLPAEPPITEDMGKGVDDLEISIQVGSMARKDEQREKAEAMDFMATVTQLATVMPNTPWVRWERLLDDVGESLGKPYFSECFDFELLQGAQGVLLEQMAQGGQGGSQDGKTVEATHNAPRVSRTQQTHVPDSRSQKAGTPGQVSGTKQGAKTKSVS